MSESCTTFGFLSCFKTICVQKQQNNENLSFYLGVIDEIILQFTIDYAPDSKQPVLAQLLKD